MTVAKKLFPYQVINTKSDNLVVMVSSMNKVAVCIIRIEIWTRENEKYAQ